MQRALRGIATVVIMAGGIMLSSTKAANAASGGGCPSGPEGFFCQWCGEMPGCSIDHCIFTVGGGDCSCSYNC